MLTQKGIKREFDREYSNLIELHRRVFDDAHEYPRQTCVIWFIDGVERLINEEPLQALLNVIYINNILQMSKDLRRTTYMSNEGKRELSNFMNTLETIKLNLIEDNYIK